MRTHAMAANTARAPAEALWRSLQLPIEAIYRLHLSDHPDPIVNSSFKLGTAAQECLRAVFFPVQWPNGTTDFDRPLGRSGSTLSPAP